MGIENDGTMSAEEMKFFETGDASVLNLADPEPEALEVAEPELEAAPVSQPDPEPAGLSAAELALENARQRLADVERQLADAQKTKPVEDPMPDKDADPLGFMIAKIDRMSREQEQLRQQLSEAKQQSELRQQFDEFTGNIRAIKNDFAKVNPDFDAAYAHLRNVKMADLVDAGLTKAQAAQRLNQEELQLAASSLERGKNPAEIVYNMAKRYGYTAQAAKTEEPAVKTAKDAQQAAEDKITRLSNGQFASRTPQRAAPPANKELTVDGLKDASDKDLNNVVLNDKMWAEIVGGKAGGDIFHH